MRAGRVSYPTHPAISVVVPLYNEEESVESLIDQVVEVLTSIGCDWEFLLIDDGSRDRTKTRVLERCEEDPRLRLIAFRANFGQTPALAAGFDHARGEVVITMDGDLQNDPRDIPRLLEEVAAGADIVSGWRKDRKDKLLTRRVPSIVANWLIGRVTGVRIHDYGCTLKAYRREVIQNLPMYSDMHRFIPALAASGGARVSELVVRHHPRRFGTSKYGISRTFKVILDLLVVQMLLRFSSRPLHWFGLLSVPCLLLSVFSLLVGFVEATGFADLAVLKLWTITFPSIAVLFLILFAHLIFVGLLSELIVEVAGPMPRRLTKSIAKEVY
ncbi:MAG: glycosyltransferase family 2 protein [Planctomycetota bacterium]